MIFIDLNIKTSNVLRGKNPF